MKSWSLSPKAVHNEQCWITDHDSQTDMSKFVVWAFTLSKSPDIYKHCEVGIVISTSQVFYDIKLYNAYEHI